MGNCSDVQGELTRIGLLLLQDRKLPSVVGIITGGSLSTSWWNHRRGHEIFACLESLETYAVSTRLIGGKVTYVHKRLWPALVAIGRSGESWQTAGLSSAARRLLKKVPTMAKGPASKELQERLLIHAEEVHTESGRHETRLQSWNDWGAAAPIELDRARAEIELAATTLGAGSKSLPWHRFAKR